MQEAQVHERGPPATLDGVSGSVPPYRSPCRSVFGRQVHRLARLQIAPLSSLPCIRIRALARDPQRKLAITSMLRGFDLYRTHSTSVLAPRLSAGARRREVHRAVAPSHVARSLQAAWVLKRRRRRVRGESLLEDDQRRGAAMVWPFSLLRRKKKAPPSLGAVLDSDRHHKGLTCIPGVGAVDLEHTIKGDHAPSTVTSGAGGARADAENAELQRSTLAPDLALVHPAARVAVAELRLSPQKLPVSPNSLLRAQSTLRPAGSAQGGARLTKGGGAGLHYHDRGGAGARAPQGRRRRLTHARVAMRGACCKHSHAAARGAFCPSALFRRRRPGANGAPCSPLRVSFREVSSHLIS